ncbi:MAG: hypothetical protein J3R72DRAFT_435235 [Linnemannia gamsii]|nr:MAG: hypothetical protein J3R72DRAFT_435235 [Linnemannia gamsii]
MLQLRWRKGSFHFFFPFFLSPVHLPLFTLSRSFFFTRLLLGFYFLSFCLFFLFLLLFSSSPFLPPVLIPLPHPPPPPLPFFATLPPLSQLH